MDEREVFDRLCEAYQRFTSVMGTSDAHALVDADKDLLIALRVFMRYEDRIRSKL